MAKVLSTTSSAPASWARLARAAMSAMPSSGLVGVSTQTIFVSVGIAAPARRRGRTARPACASRPQRCEHLVEEAVRAAVGVVGQHHVVTRVEQPADHGVLGGQAGGEREAPLALLQRREGVLERGAGGVGGAAVLVAAAQPADAVLLVGRGREDGRDHRSGGRVGLVARVDRTRLEAGLLAVLLGHPASVTTDRRWSRADVARGRSSTDRDPVEPPLHARAGGSRPGADAAVMLERARSAVVESRSPMSPWLRGSGAGRLRTTEVRHPG